MIDIKDEFERRIPGLLYLVLAITGFYTPFVINKFYPIANSIDWYDAILRNQLFYSSGILSFYLMNISWLLLALSFYNIFSPKHKTLSRLFLLSVICGSVLVFIQITIKSLPLFLLSVISQNDGKNKLLIEQVHTLGIILTKSNLTAYLFYAVWLFPLAAVFYKNKQLLKIERIILSISLFLAGFGYLFDFLWFYIYPKDGGINLTHMTFWGEVVILLWLLIKGIKKEQERNLI